jgi:hypothetical protein
MAKSSYFSHNFLENSNFISEIAHTVRQRQHFGDEVTLGLFGVFMTPLGGGVGNSGGDALLSRILQREAHAVTLKC